MNVGFDNNSKVFTKKKLMALNPKLYINILIVLIAEKYLQKRLSI